MVWSSSRARNIFNSSTPDNSSPLISAEGVLSSDQSSEGEFVEGEEKPWPPESHFSRSRDKRQEPRLPRPHSHLFRTKDGRSRGSKHTRRWENSLYLRSLHGIPEEELGHDITINPPHNSPLTRLHTSDKHMQIWCSYSAQSETEQPTETGSTIVTTMGGGGGEAVRGEGGEAMRGGGGEAVRGEEAYRRIDRRIRSILAHNKHIPMGLVEEVEDELREVFSLDRTSVVILLQTNPFCRLLLHGVSQYLGLSSTTEVFGGVSLMVIVCERDQFTPPRTTLVNHYQQQR